MFLRTIRNGLLFALFVALPAQSGELHTASEPPPISLSLGIGAAYVPDYEGSDDYKLVPIPRLGIDNINGRETYVRFSGRLDSNIIEHPHWRFGLSAFYQSDYQDDSRFGEIEDDQVSLLEDTENALQTGFTLGYDFSADPRRQYLLEVTATRDVLHGNGDLVTPRFRLVRFLSRRLVFSGAVSASWASDQYMENWFGISETDAMRSGLPAYTAKGGLKNVAVEAALTWIICPEWTVTAFASYLHLTGDAADSPIVDQRGDAGNRIMGALLTRQF